MLYLTSADIQPDKLHIYYNILHPYFMFILNIHRDIYTQPEEVSKFVTWISLIRFTNSIEPIGKLDVSRSS